MMAHAPAQTQVHPETDRQKIARIIIEGSYADHHAVKVDYLGVADRILAEIPLLSSGQDSLRAQLLGISERMDGCFEPTIPPMPIMSELILAVRDAVIQLRILGESLPATPSIEKNGG